MKTKWLGCRETPQRQFSGHNTPFDHHTNCCSVGLGQYDGLIGEYCGLDTASSVFAILILQCCIAAHIYIACASTYAGP